MKINLSRLTSLCPVRSSRKVSQSVGGPVLCVFCTLDMHVCGQEMIIVPVDLQR